MVATETTSDIGTFWMRSHGSIAEVLINLSSQGFTANNVIYWSDDGTDAKAVACRVR
jgi:hypothetical protein